VSLLDLQPEEESQFAHHAHLKFPTHSICKLGNKSMRRDTKDYIIHIYLNQKGVSALLEEEQSLIYGTHPKTLIKQEGFQMLIPGSWGLFQAIQSFIEFKNIVRKLRIFKARGLSHINLFLYIPIQEGTLHIHLIQLKPFRSRKG
jgi:hypothetical protein